MYLQKKNCNLIRCLKTSIVIEPRILYYFDDLLSWKCNFNEKRANKINHLYSVCMFIISIYIANL
jgi:hypothetical protein